MSTCTSLPVMLKELRLATIGRHWAELASSDKARKWSHEQFLSALCELEITHRHSRRLAGYHKESKLPAGKTLPSFDFDQDKGINRAQIEALSNNVDWISQAWNLLLFGASGLGKTHPACAIGARLIEQGVRVRHYPATALVQELQRARDGYCLESHLHKLDNSSVTSSIRFDVTIQALNSFFRCVTSTNGRKSYHPLIALRFKIAHWCS